MEEGNPGAQPETEGPVSDIDPFAGGVKEIGEKVQASQDIGKVFLSMAEIVLEMIAADLESGDVFV